MKKYNTLLFDMDGTLIQSEEGIIKSVSYALEKLKMDKIDKKKLRAFIGPPLFSSLAEHAGLTGSKADLAVRYYRERYSAVGIFECTLFPGMRELLVGLKKRGCALAVASAKPEDFVVRILEHFDLTGYFDEAVGSTLDNKRTEKAEVIEEALRRLKMKDKRGSVLMIGDKGLDVNGARKAAIACIAVSYGFGSVEELKEAAPEKIAASVDELRNILYSLTC